eukprot:548322-Rhodomonas_salina.5
MQHIKMSDVSQMRLLQVGRQGSDPGVNDSLSELQEVTIDAAQAQIRHSPDQNRHSDPLLVRARPQAHTSAALQ